MNKIFILLLSLSLYAATSNLELGLKYYEDNTLKDKVELVKQLKKEAINGSNDSAFLLATAYKNALLINSKEDNALKWYKICAKNNDADAMLIIGWIYYEGTDYQDKDEDKAIEWFEKAADNGVIEAIEMLHMIE